MAVEITGYKIVDLLHRSDLTSVYSAASLENGEDVVIKTLSAEYPRSRDLAGIRREFEITNRLSETAGVVRVLALENHGNRNLAIVMEPFGQSLSDFLSKRNGQPVELEWFLNFAIKLVRHVGAIHNAGIVHKDVVPRNILLNTETDDVRLIDFGIASELSRERQSVNLARRLEGSLPYISPEQTGRMNRDLDYRSDYYSIGMTLFELLVGKLPFDVDSALEWIGCHISKRPPAPAILNLSVPNAVSQIILKLIAKNADDRYQSSFGLIFDLENCLKQLRQNREIKDFPLGEKDVPEIFQISQRIFGRDRELATLFERFERVTLGANEICMISGYSGAGKSALVNEVQLPIVQANGFFIQGKIDQYQRTTPYSAIAAAFAGLVGQLLALSANQLAAWKTKLLATLGSNAQIIVDIVPELERIIGKQPPVTGLPPTESQNRLQIVFQIFIQQFATKDHPLVLFVDDLQWCDAPTLDLIKKLATSREITHFFLIGTFRENEVDEGHLLSLSLDEISKTKDVCHLKLAALSREAINQIVAGTLNLKLRRASNLTELFYEKIAGNPFFLTELLKALHEDGYLQLDPETGEWTWDPKNIARAKFGGGVVEFMMTTLRKLPTSTQSVLSVAACIGSTFDLRMLATVSGKSPSKTNRELHAALAQGFIIPLGGDYRLVVGDGEEDVDTNPSYKFQHDRIQQAAYSLLKKDEKQKMHLSIGRLIRKNSDDTKHSERIIELVGHLNTGRSLIVKPDEIDDLAELNLQAVITARDSAAYRVALEYCEVGTELMSADAWSTRYGLMLEMQTEYCRCAYLEGRYDIAEAASESILTHVKTPAEKAKVLAMRTRQYATMGRMADSITAAIEGLNTLGIDFSDDPDDASIKQELAAVKRNLGRRKISDLINADSLVDDEITLAADILMEIFPAAFLSGSGTLFPYLVLKSVNLSLKHGNSASSAFSYAAYGMLLCGTLNDPATGYEYGKLALKLNDQLDDIQLKARVIYLYGMFIHHWSNHWTSLTPWFLKAIEAGYQSGDLLYLAYSAQDCIIWDPTLDLQAASAEQRKYLAIVKDCEYQDSFDSGSLFLQLQLNFQGLTKNRFSLTDEHFDEEEVYAGMLNRKFMTGIANYHIYKTEIHYFFDDYENALTHIDQQDELINSSMSLPQLVRFVFMSFLTRAELISNSAKTKQKAIRKRLEQSLQQMSNWASNCEENFLHLQLAMEAELARLDGQGQQAISLYTAAAEKAQKNQFFRDEAMINELAGKYFVKLGFSTAAKGYLQTAMMVYDQWGAAEKVSQLQEVYPSLLLSSTPTLSKDGSSTKTGSSTVDQGVIDLESVIKASMAISGELDLTRLWNTVMELLLENAGAQRGYFVWQKGGELYLGAKAGDTSLKAEPSLVEPMNEQASQSWLPITMVNFVVRSSEQVLLDDASKANRFSSDPYIVSQTPKSILCIPLNHSDKFSSAIYLENNLVAAAFSEDRIEVLKLLAAQASISIENAQLYDSLEGQIEERTRELSEKSNALEQLSNQLSKYLSPQIYQSIFDSRQEVKLISQRKRLTVFFSDLVGFTESADRLESEELTQVLNDYLTEMSDIAIAHGATIDKFVGDGIMIFFGDPETRGSREDALACVTMAIAMRKRMHELEIAWRASGFENPMRCRMGINTGYCTVGNFGSEARMDYTIIGGNVNLAARLEAAAPTDEILISYETWSLIQNKVLCEEKGHINVKGIAHPIGIYQVVDLHENLKDGVEALRAETAHLKLDIDIDKMSMEERQKSAVLLEDFVRRLTDKDTGD